MTRNGRKGDQLEKLSLFSEQTLCNTSQDRGLQTTITESRHFLSTFRSLINGDALINGVGGTGISLSVYCNKKCIWVGENFGLLKFGLSGKHTKICTIFLMLWTFT